MADGKTNDSAFQMKISEGNDILPKEMTEFEIAKVTSQGAERRKAANKRVNT